MEGREFFRNICAKNSFDISAEQIDKLSAYVKLLLEWNGKINLISRRDEENIWTRHILGSTAFLLSSRFKNNSTVVDVGTGGGLPGIPLAILCPDCSFVLADSIRKKITAVENMIASLCLPNVSAIVGRAEEISGTEAYRNKFDYVIARAVAPVADIVRWCRPFLKSAAPGSPEADFRSVREIPSGTIVLLKGGDLTAEIESAKVKFNPIRINASPIIVEGIGPDDLPDKKLIIIGINVK